MDFGFLPAKIGQALQKCDIDKIYEIRLRAEQPVKVNYNSKKVYLTENGLSDFKFNAITIDNADLLDTVNNLTEHSLYAYNERIKEGYLTTRNGIRIGLCGECVFDNGKIITIKNFSSLNLRIPHDVDGCSSQIYKKIFAESLLNTLIISPPSKGKTTILKDLVKKINNDCNKSILIIDERGELSNLNGENLDIISFCNKNYAFEYGIRSMGPEIIIMDELSTESDWQCVQTAVKSGIKLIATAHGSSLENIIDKKIFVNSVFERYVLLDGDKKAGTLKNIYDKEYGVI